MSGSTSRWVRPAQLAMDLLSGVSLAAAAYAFMAQFGWFSGFLPRDEMPDWLRQRWSGFDAVMSAPVRLHSQFWGQSDQQLSGFSGSGEAPSGWAEFAGGHRNGWATFWDPGFGTEVMWGIGIALPSLALAMMWFLLARIVRTCAHREPFTRTNARRLGIIGFGVLVVPYLALGLQRTAQHFALSHSTLAGKASLMSMWPTAPIWPLGAGLAILVLSAVWRVGVQIRDDVDGLV